MKKAKRVLSVLLAVFLLASCLPITAWADEAVTSGWCGELAYWSFHADDGTLIISGRGAMYDYRYDEDSDYEYEDEYEDVPESAPWLSFGAPNWTSEICEGIKSIVIGQGITHIGANAFANVFSYPGGPSYMPNLESVTISDTVVSIGYGAFADNCPEEIFIPASVKQIGSDYSAPWIGTPDDFGGYVFHSERVKSIVVDSNNKNYKSIDGILYKKGDKPALIEYPSRKTLDELYLPGDLQVLNTYSMNGPKKLHIPSSVTTVKNFSYLLGGEEPTEEVYFYDNAPREFTFSPFEDAPFSMSTLTVYYPTNGSGWDKVISACDTWQADFYREYIQFKPWTPGAYPATEAVNWASSGDNTGGNTGGNPGGTNPPAPSGPSGPSDTEKPDNSGDETPSASKFIDVPVAQYYYNAVDWAVKQGIVAGTSDTTFSPNQNTTRKEIVTLLWRAAGRPEPKIAINPFTDVKESDYYYKAVLWAYENKIAAGTSDTAFSPNQNCTRAQTVAFLYRYNGSPAASGSDQFTDVPSGEYYANAVAWATASNIVFGTSKDKFSPNSTCTRAQSVTFLYRNLAG